MIARVKTQAKQPAGRNPKTSRHPVAVATRLDDMVEFVTAQGKANLAEIAAEMGYTNGTARTYAINLCEEGKLHRLAEFRANGGLMHVYYPGPAPVGAVPVPSADEDEFNRPAPKVYPPCHRRDLWACAMFPVPAVLLEQRA